jgi:FKBP-type peptidyl-prolyl cis-trans isomerase SlyD
LKIAKDTVVLIEYTIRNAEGRIVDTSVGRGPLEYLHGYHQIVPGVERAVEGLLPGSSLDVELPPSEGYGVRDPDAVMVIPRRFFPSGDEVEPGTLFRALRPDGRPVIFSVIEVLEDTVVVDANHPLAGQTLKVRVEVLSVRQATDEERAHKHVHDDVPTASTSTPLA